MFCVRKIACRINLHVGFEKAHTPKRGRGRPKKEDAAAKLEAKPEETNPAEVKAEVAAKAETAETKPSKSDMKPVIAAMYKIGDLAMRDIPALERHSLKPKGMGRRRAPTIFAHSLSTRSRSASMPIRRATRPRADGIVHPSRAISRSMIRSSALGRSGAVSRPRSRSARNMTRRW